MSNLSSNLKQWGSTGTEYPNGYNYLEGEQPVDEWDNYVTYHTVEEVHALQSVVNDRMESDVTGGGTHPGSPEVGHLSHRTDTSNLPTGDEATFVYDGTNSVWHRLLKADGDTMDGSLDMGGYMLKDESGQLNIGSDTDVKGVLSVTQSATIDGSVTANSASLETEWLSKQEGGSVSAGGLVVLGQFGLADGETLHVSQAVLSEDGFTTPAASGVNLVVATDPTAASADATILSGDGTTLYDDETTGWSYTNTSGGPQTAVIALDNGHYGAGVGSEVRAFGGFIARVE